MIWPANLPLSLAIVCLCYDYLNHIKTHRNWSYAEVTFSVTNFGFFTTLQRRILAILVILAIFGDFGHFGCFVLYVYPYWAVFGLFWAILKCQILLEWQFWNCWNANLGNFCLLKISFQANLAISVIQIPQNLAISVICAILV